MTPITIIQAKNNPEWDALFARFSLVRPQRKECENCGVIFEAKPANRCVARYCSDACRAQANRDLQRRVRAGRRAA